MARVRTRGPCLRSIARRAATISRCSARAAAAFEPISEFLTDPRDTNLVVPSPIGVGWTLHFGRVLRGGNLALCDNANLNPRRMPVPERPDGSRQVLSLVPDRTHWLSTTRRRARCEGSASVVSSPDGTRYEMGRPGIGIGTTLTAVWHASRIVDRNGNALALTYTDLAAATAVERIVGRTSNGLPDGREVVFTDVNNALSTVSDGARVWRYGHVTSPDGGPTYPFLDPVQRPDGRSGRFEYNLTVAQ